LGIGKGDIVLLPSYNCGVELDPFIKRGIEPRFYRIDKNLRVDLDDVRSRISDKVKAILVTHFLGFPQTIDALRRLCREKGVRLIEDCAHALLSDGEEAPLGSYGDIAIFSVLKTLPVPNGGLLVINDKSLGVRNRTRRPDCFSTLFYASELLSCRTLSALPSLGERVYKIFYGRFYAFLTVVRLFLAGVRKVFRLKGGFLVRPDSYLFVEDVCGWGMSSLSARILNATHLDEVKQARRKNFEYLLRHFVTNNQVSLPFTELPPGVCPLFFPIILRNAEKRNKIYKTLKSRGIITHPWWDRFHPDVPWSEFPDAVLLKERLFGFPVHQDLTSEHLDLAIQEFERAYDNNEGEECLA
jgi:dTDP-4-amino-4,6-dideoxygalactose transaminase